jgi:iron complex transport system substrate-binding protein
MRYLLLIFIICSCGKSIENKDKSLNSIATDKFIIEYASGFNVDIIENGYIVSITEPWPKAKESFKYLLYRNKETLNKNYDVDYSIQIPLRSIVTTSTTHIPSLDTLDVLDKLIGFPNTNYISTEKAIALIENGEIKDVGQNESLNTELLIELNPDALITFGVKGQNKSVEVLQKAGIPILYNSDWVETNVLGKAEWIKFFGLLFDKTEDSQKIFNGIKKEYEEAKAIAKQAENKPTVISGALWKDTWYLPAGNSWQSQILADANADYLYSETEGTGSLSLSFESVFSKSKNAEFWIAPAQYTSYNDMLDQHPHYEKFSAFQEKKIFTFSSTLGKNGGVLFYEIAPNRPDIVLKDLIHILHPELIESYEPRFFKPLNP